MAEMRTWRVMFKVNKDTPEVCHTIGVDSDDGMYRVLRHLSGKDAKMLFSFEAHQFLPGGEVRVVRGGSHAEGVQSTAATTEEPKADTIVIPLLPPPDQKEGGIKEGAVRAYPYRMISVSEVLLQCRI